jgi:hypothetical protein
MADYTTITYRDELLPDQSVKRSYSDGTVEWRRRLPDKRVEWQDTRGRSGVDELLGDGVVKRLLNDGAMAYGKEQGYGRTAWVSGGTHVLTVNETSLGGRAGALLATIGATGLLGAVTWPPAELSLADEEALREAQRRQQTTDGSGGGSETSWESDNTAGDGDFG